MDNILSIPFVFVTISLVTVVFLLSQEHKKLKQQYNLLKEQLERNNKDIAGLCSAAVSVDTQLSNSNEQLKSLVDKVIDFEEDKQQEHQPYYSAIQKVKQGASVDELIRQCGLTQEEAILLNRLHGSN
jgi:chromosome segregation ATPase